MSDYVTDADADAAMAAGGAATGCILPRVPFVPQAGGTPTLHNVNAG